MPEEKQSSRALKWQNPRMEGAPREKGAGKGRPGVQLVQGRTQRAAGAPQSPAAPTVSPRPLVTLSQLSPAPPSPEIFVFALQQPQPRFPNPGCSPQRVGAPAFLQPQRDAGHSQTYLKLLFQAEQVPPSSEAASPRLGWGLSHPRSWRGVLCAPAPPARLSWDREGLWGLSWGGV